MKNLINKWIVILLALGLWAGASLYLPSILFLFSNAILVTGLCITILLKQRVSRYVQQIINSIERFKAGDRSARAPTKQLIELDPITQSINNLFDTTQYVERRLNERHTRYKSLIDMMADGLITVRSDGTIESMNRAAGRLLGYGEDELVGSNFASIATDPKAQATETYLDSFIQCNADAKPNLETQVRTKNGRDIPVRLSVSKMDVQGKGLFIGVLSDISQIKSMELKLRALNEELSRTNEQLAKTAITDGLTDLFNRRHFDSVFIKELQRATRQRTSISLLIVDIDFFKQFNDIYGHTAGDECIKKVSFCIKKVFKRSGDLPARYGGEEFAVILPGCDGLELQERAETLRHAICGMNIPHSGSTEERILTVSIGAVTYKPASMEVVVPKPKELFSEADKALYRAKAKGRNQVVFAGQYQPLRVPSATAHLYGQLMSR